MPKKKSVGKSNKSTGNDAKDYKGGVAKFTLNQETEFAILAILRLMQDIHSSASTEEGINRIANESDASDVRNDDSSESVSSDDSDAVNDDSAESVSSDDSVVDTGEEVDDVIVETEIVTADEQLDEVHDVLFSYSESNDSSEFRVDSFSKKLIRDDRMQSKQLYKNNQERKKFLQLSYNSLDHSSPTGYSDATISLQEDVNSVKDTVLLELHYYVKNNDSYVKQSKCKVAVFERNITVIELVLTARKKLNLPLKFDTLLLCHPQALCGRLMTPSILDSMKLRFIPDGSAVTLVSSAQFPELLPVVTLSQDLVDIEIPSDVSNNSKSESERDADSFVELEVGDRQLPDWWKTEQRFGFDFGVRRSSDYIYNSQMQSQQQILMSSAQYEAFRLLRESLPIHSSKHELLHSIENHSVILVAGETGSGKVVRLFLLKQ